MRAIISLALLGTFVSGCTWTNPSKPLSAFPRDSYSCEQQALRQYPQVIGGRVVDGDYYRPAETHCHYWRDGNGQTCETYPGEYVPPVVAAVDLNSSQRRRGTLSCLEANGWSQTPGFSGVLY